MNSTLVFVLFSMGLGLIHIGTNLYHGVLAENIPQEKWRKEIPKILSAGLLFGVISFGLAWGSFSLVQISCASGGCLF